MELVRERTLHSSSVSQRCLLVAKLFLLYILAYFQRRSVSVSEYNEISHLHYNKIARRTVIKIMRSSTGGRMRQTIASHAYAYVIVVAICRHVSSGWRITTEAMRNMHDDNTIQTVPSTKWMPCGAQFHSTH